MGRFEKYVGCNFKRSFGATAIIKASESNDKYLHAGKLKLFFYVFKCLNIFTFKM